MRQGPVKIKKSLFFKADLGLINPYSVTYRTVEKTENLFVFIELDNGLYGIGSGSPSPYVTGEEMDLSLAQLDENLEALTRGKDIRHFQSIIRASEELMRDYPAARAALDTALHDAFSKYLDIPLVDFFGRVHQALPTSITIGLKDLEAILEEGKKRVREGFKIIKLKIGLDPELEIEKFSKLREQVGKDIKIRVDANQGYSVEDTQAFFAATEELDLEFMEQPLRPNNLDGMHRLSRKIREKCAADEIMQKPKDALLLAQSPKAFGIFNIKLMKCGGLSPALEIARIAQRSNIELMWGCNDESSVSISAALHTALACPATRYLDLDGSLDLGNDFASGGFMLKDGLMHLEDKPGLGVSIKDMGKIALLS